MSVSLQLRADGLGDADDEVLGAAVGGAAGEPGLARLRGEVDDVAAAAALHARQGELHPVHDAVHVDVDQPLRGQVVLVDEPPEGHDPGVVDEHVERAEALLDLVEKALEGVAAGDVELERDRVGADLGGGRARPARGRGRRSRPWRPCAPAPSRSPSPIPRAPPVIATTFPFNERACAAIGSPPRGLGAARGRLRGRSLSRRDFNWHARTVSFGASWQPSSPQPASRPTDPAPARRGSPRRRRRCRRTRCAGSSTTWWPSAAPGPSRPDPVGGASPAPG